MSNRRRADVGTTITVAVGLVVTLTVAIQSATVAQTNPPRTQLVSTNSDGQQANGQSVWASISADGRYVAFASMATNLTSVFLPSDDNVYRKDRQTGAVELVNVPLTQERSGRTSTQPVISADGRFVAFTSDSQNLVEGDTNSPQDHDAFVRDMVTGTTRRISVNSAGEQSNGHSNYVTSMSPDGRFVSFISTASNLVTPNTEPGIQQLYRHDRQNGTTTLGSAGPNGPSQGGVAFGSVSGDGSLAVFDSADSTLTSGDYDGIFSKQDAYSRNLATGVTTILSAGLIDGQPIESGRSPVISADGTTVYFAASTCHSCPEVAVINDLTTGEITVLARDVDGQPAPASTPAAVSPTGRFVAFASYSTALTANSPEQPRWQVYVKDRQTGNLTLFSINDAGQAAERDPGIEGPFDITDDGSTVAFTAYATDLVPNDTNAAADVFVRGPEFMPSPSPSSTSSSSTSTTSTTTILPPRVLQYVALGDSFSSGEGTFDYDPDGEACHRGEEAWPRIMAAELPTVNIISHRACTGARTEHFYRSNDDKNEPAQVPLHRTFPNVDLVTFTIGGNDVDFRGILVECRIQFFGFERHNCEDIPDSWEFQTSLTILKHQLTGIIYPLLRVIYPNARLVHVGYPRLVPEPGDPIIECDWLSGTEQIAMDRIGSMINSTIAEAARSSSLSIEYLNVTNALNKHELCTSDSWVFPIIFSLGTPTVCREPDDVTLCTEQAHPDRRGQRALAAEIRRQLGL